MAIEDLHCVRVGNELAVIWSWGRNEKQARIKVTQLLTGEEVEDREISRAAYCFALASPRHGPVVKVPAVPLKIEVSDSESSQSMELSDVHYTVNWRLIRHNVYQTGKWLRQVLARTETKLQVRFPKGVWLSEDLFCYVLVRPGRKRSFDDPIGFFPSLKPGDNEYSVIVPSGRELELCCSPGNEAAAQLFDFKRLPDKFE